MIDVWLPLAEGDPRLTFEVEESLACKRCNRTATTRTTSEACLWFGLQDTRPAFSTHAKCPDCGGEGALQRVVQGTPPVVVLWMPRAEGDGNRSERAVRYTPTLEHNHERYALIGLMCHSGPVRGGHWWAEVMGPTGDWVRADDQQISSAVLPESGAEACGLLYVRANASEPLRRLIQHSTPPPAISPPAPAATEVRQCAAHAKAGQCKAAPVEGFDRCPAHLYGRDGEGVCGRTTAQGKRCVLPNAKGMQACALHVVPAASAMGYRPPIPGKGLTSGGKLQTAQVPEAPRQAPARTHAPPTVASSDTGAAAALARPEPPEAFRGGHLRMPTVAALKGHALVQLELLPNDAMPKAALGGLSAKQRAEHRRVWRRLIGMPPELQKLQLPVAALTTMETWREAAQWCPTTWTRMLGSAMGALARASLYTSSQYDLPVAQTAPFKDALRAAKKAEHAFTSRPPKPCTEAQVARAVTLAADPAVKEQLVVAWLTAGRVGCVLQLQREDVTLDAEGRMSVQFRRGKGVTMGAPYTVHTACPPQWQEAVKALLKRVQKGFLWPCDSREARVALGKGVAAALKRVDPQLEQRSLRRGALQAMAEKGVDESVLMSFSGHRRVDTLHRYLDWGRKAGGRARKAQEAARHLAGGPLSA